MGRGIRCRFMQIGDIHLGTQQYDSPERLNDFGRTWLFACERAARTRPDFVVCTGDLFNRFTINPVTFDQAYAGLCILREAGVPIVDIAGNHDRARYGEGKSWLETLADQGLLTYLDVPTGAEGITLEPVTATRRRGSYVEWNGCRIIGLRYLGASTERVLEAMEAELDRLGRDAFTILVVHAGLEGIIPHFNAELTPAALERLRERVDYVALGHIHKSYHAVGDLAHNAGSLETWALNEWGWPRGILDVEVDTDRSPVVTTRLVDVPRRHFSLVRVDVGPYDSPRALEKACWDLLIEERNRVPQERPVAVLTLHGHLKFDSTDLPINKIDEALRAQLEPLVAIVREYTDNAHSPTLPDDPEERVDRAALERAVLRSELSKDERYAPHAEQLATLALDLKDNALRDVDGPALVNLLRGGLRQIVLPPPTNALAPPDYSPALSNVAAIGPISFEANGEAIGASGADQPEVEGPGELAEVTP